MTRCCYVIVVCLWRRPCFLATYQSMQQRAMQRDTTSCVSGSQGGRAGIVTRQQIEFIRWSDRRCFDPICLQFAKEMNASEASHALVTHTAILLYQSPLLGPYHTTCHNPVSPRRIIEWTRCNSNLWHVRTPWTYPMRKARWKTSPLRASLARVTRSSSNRSAIAPGLTVD